MNAKKDKRSITLKNLLILLQMLVLVVTVVFYAGYEYRLVQSIEGDLLERFEAVFDGILGNFERNRADVVSIMDYIGRDDDLRSRLLASDFDSTDYLEYISPFLAGTPVINGIYLILPDGRFFASESSRFSQQTVAGFDVSGANGMIECYNAVSSSGASFDDSLQTGIYYAAPFVLNGRNGTLLVDINVLLFGQSQSVSDDMMVCGRDGRVLFEGENLRGFQVDEMVFIGGEGDIDHGRSGSGVVLRRELTQAPLVFYYYDQRRVLHQSTFNLAVYAASMLVLCLIINHFTRRITTRYLLGPILETGRKMQQAYIIGMTETFMLPGGKRSPKSAALSVYFFLLMSVIAPFLLFSALASFQNTRIINEVYAHYARTGYLNAAEQLQSSLQAKESLVDTLADQQNQTLGSFLEQIDALYARYRMAGLENESLSLFNSEGTLLFRTGLDAGSELPLDMKAYGWVLGDGLQMNALRTVSFAPEGTECTLMVSTDNVELAEFTHDIERGSGVVLLCDLGGGLEELAGKVTPQGAEIFKDMAHDSREAFSWELNGWTGASFKAYDGDFLVTAMIFSGNIRQSAGAVAEQIRYIGIMLLLVLLFVSYLLAVQLSSMIGKVNQYFGSINVLDDHTAQPNDFFIAELSAMENAFNGMVEKNRMLIDELISSNNEKNRIEIKIKDSEIRALQAQINPHFLHNTLNSIVALIDNDQKEEAKRVIRMVGTLFRCGISRKDITISIREEIEYLDAYLNIMALRYGKRFSYRIDVPEELYRYSTLKLILQPIVENCLMHGQKKNNRNLVVTVSGREEEHRIVFKISDNGVGMNETQLYILQKQLEEEGTENHIGLINVQTRLRLNFGPQYGIEVNSKPGEGTVVRVSIKKIPIND